MKQKLVLISLRIPAELLEKIFNLFPSGTKTGALLKALHYAATKSQNSTEDRPYLKDS
jgi:hypothetical protein